MKQINSDFTKLRKGSKFVKRYMFGGKIHIVEYTVIETHRYNGSGYILARRFLVIGCDDIYDCNKIIRRVKNEGNF